MVQGALEAIAARRCGSCEGLTDLLSYIPQAVLRTHLFEKVVAASSSSMRWLETGPVLHPTIFLLKVDSCYIVIIIVTIVIRPGCFQSRHAQQNAKLLFSLVFDDLSWEGELFPRFFL